MGDGALHPGGADADIVVHQRAETASTAFSRGEEAARHRVLRAWRRLGAQDFEEAMGCHDRASSELIPKVLAALRLDERVMESQLTRIWPKVVDPIVAHHAQPVGLAKGTLFVNVDSNVWLSEIVRYRRREILERLQHALGKNLVQRISFRLG